MFLRIQKAGKKILGMYHIYILFQKHLMLSFIPVTPLGESGDGVTSALYEGTLAESIGLVSPGYTMCPALPVCCSLPSVTEMQLLLLKGLYHASGHETGSWLPCGARPSSCGEAHDGCFPEEVTHSFIYFRCTDTGVTLFTLILQLHLCRQYLWWAVLAWPCQNALQEPDWAIFPSPLLSLHHVSIINFRVLWEREPKFSHVS